VPVILSQMAWVARLFPRAVLLLCAISATSATASPITVPLPAGEELLREQETQLDTLLLPVGPVAGDDVPVRALEGRIYRRSWRLNGDWSALQVLAPIRKALTERGFEEVFACTAAACGGFGFRFGIEVIPAPDMAVNLSDYEFLAAQHPESGVAVSLLVSRSAGSIYVQLLERHDPEQLLRPLAPPEGVGAPSGTDEAATPTSLGEETATPSGPQALLADAITKGGRLSTGAIADLIVLQGHVPLLDLEFASGSTRMGDGPFDSLRQLAAFLTERENATILLVGHTDTVGGLDSNIALSRRRAASVRERLISRYDIAGDRIQVAGAGFMAPLAPNTTEAGRETNRRVEAVLVRP